MVSALIYVNKYRNPQCTVKCYCWINNPLISPPRDNPSNAEATLVKSMRMQSFFENRLNPIMLVSIG